MKGLGEWEEKPISQNKNRNSYMKGKDFNLSANFPQKIKMMIFI